MRSVGRRWWWWAGLNAAGMAVYLRLASALWVRPAEERLPGGPGDAFAWAFTLLPILAGFLILAVATLLYLLLKVPRPARRTALVFWLVVVALWCVVVAYDHHRSARTIDAEYAGSVVPTRIALGHLPARPPAASAT